MKNETTFDIELGQLQNLFQERKFEECEQLATRMLRDYNAFDYELLLQRARIRQCQQKYEEALADANLALQVQPNKLDAYHQLSDCLIATQRLPEAVKLLQILSKSDPSNATLSSQYEMLKSQTGPKTKEAALAKLRKSFGPQAKAQKKIRDQTEDVSDPANFEAMLKFVKEDRETILQTIDETEANEKKIEPA